MFRGENIKKLVSTNLALLCILAGILLVSLSVGPFQNPDTTWEYKATSGVLTWGMPFVEVQGSLINQPPLGFYAEAGFLHVFGLSMNTGVVFITLLGVACAFLVYKLGKTLYGKKAGMLAAALFGLTTWQLVLSRSLLIDTQCLLLSLSSLYVGIQAIRSNSNKLLAASGVLFALAFFTKFFAIFSLIPLSLFYLYEQRDRFRRLPVKLAVFFLPVALAFLVWGLVVFYMMPSWLPNGLGYLFVHSDFHDLNAAGTVPSAWFVGTFLFNYGLGAWFLAAAVFSLILGLVFRKHFERQMVVWDAILWASILPVLALVMYLGVALNLKVPYTSTIKYAYQTLPLFSLAAASLAVKSASLLRWAKTGVNPKKLFFTVAGVAGFFLLATSVVWSLFSAHELSMTGFIVFRVEMSSLLGYSFDNHYALTQTSPLLIAQYVGFGLVLFGLFWEGKSKLFRWFSRSSN